MKLMNKEYYLLDQTSTNLYLQLSTSSNKCPLPSTYLNSTQPKLLPAILEVILLTRKAILL